MNLPSVSIGHRRLLASARTGLLACSLLTMFALPATARAHELKTDGNITAVLHTDPDDNPTTGSPTKYIVFFADATGRFNLTLCNCTVSIIEHNKTIATAPLTISSADVGAGNYTFTKPAVYTLRFSGTPKQPDAFQPFTLDYEIPVTGNETTSQSTPTLIWITLGILIALVLVVGYITNRGASKGSQGRRT